MKMRTALDMSSKSRPPRRIGGDARSTTVSCSVLTRTPLRLCIGGGATDIRPYYSKHEGFALSGTINHFIEVSIKRRTDHGIRIRCLGDDQACDKLGDVRNPIVRRALQFLGIRGGIEIASRAGIAPGCGPGSSGCFGVGLLHALHGFLGESVTAEQLASEACYVEMDLLKWPSGKQDQYTAAFGGLVGMNIDRGGDVQVQRLRITGKALQRFGIQPSSLRYSVEKRSSNYSSWASRRRAAKQGCGCEAP